MHQAESTKVDGADSIPASATSTAQTSCPTRQSVGHINVAVFTGGFDQPYAFGLCTALARRGIRLDALGSDTLDSPEMRSTPGLRFLNVHGRWPSRASRTEKAWKTVGIYGRLLRYALTTNAGTFHVLWHNKAPYFDRTVLMAVYKLLGKRVALTAHNINAGKRDGNDSMLNRLSLRVQYHLADGIFVHTNRMRDELMQDFAVSADRVHVIPFGVNNAVPHTSLSPDQARRTLGIELHDKVVLFFGNIRPYKGLEYLVKALELLEARGEGRYRLIIAGERNPRYIDYWNAIARRIDTGPLRDRVLMRTEYIPDSATELYFKAADVSVLPYTHVYQSGVLFLGYSFGLPAVATRVGSIDEDVIEGQTGFTCMPCDAHDLANVISRYFQSALYAELGSRRSGICHQVWQKHSWDLVAEMTESVYRKVHRR